MNCRSLFLSAALLLSGAQISFGDQTLATFDTDTAGWSWEDFSVAGEVVFDPADDADGDPNSGSMQLIGNFAAKTEYQQSVFTVGINPAPNLSSFSKIALDVKLDPDSALRANGSDAGHLEIILRLGSAWVWTPISFDALSNNNWTHLEANIPTVTAPNDTLSALTLKIGDGDFTGPVKIHVDNIRLMTRPEPVTVLNAFNDETELTAWSREPWADKGLPPEFDPSNDAQGSAGSGSLKIVADFENDSAYKQAVYLLNLNPPIDGVTYSQIALDLKVDPANSTKRTGAEDYGSFEIIGRNGPEWTWNPFTSFTLTDSGWVHLVANIVPPHDAIHHLNFKLGGSGFAGPVTFNIDNLVLIENTNKTIEPPTMSLQKTEPGLNIVASQLQAQHQRQSIYTVGSDFSWVGRTAPVTYSIEFSKYPDAAAYPGFQSHIFLVPQDPAPQNADVDWSTPHMIFVDILSQTDGTTIGRFRYKINEPVGNDMIYGPGTLGAVTNSSPTGKWSLTFSSDTHATLTAPDGNSVQVDIPAEAAELFNAPLHAYFGVQPNQLVNIGQGVTVKKIEITGTDTPLSDTFSGETLNSELWAVAAVDAKGIQVIRSETPWRASWTTPAAGFVLQTTGNLSTPAWTDINAPSVAIGSTMQSLINNTNLPAGNAAFFRLIKR